MELYLNKYHMRGIIRDEHMDAQQLREAFVKFFEERGHAHIDSASLIPENDPTVLFTTAGMHPGHAHISYHTFLGRNTPWAKDSSIIRNASGQEILMM